MSITVNNVYLEGSQVKVAFTFTDETQTPPAPADPSTITFKTSVNGVAQPNAVYPSGTIVHDSTGSFHVLIDTTNLPGTWAYSFTSTGVQGAGEGGFYVQPLIP